MKKYGWLLALFIALALLFTGCPGGGEDPIEDPEGPDNGSGDGQLTLQSAFPNTIRNQVANDVNVTVVLSGNTLTITGNGDNVDGELVNDLTFDAAPYRGIKFQYKSNADVSFLVQDVYEIFHSTESGTGDGWWWIIQQDDWSNLEILFSNLITHGWVSGSTSTKFQPDELIKFQIRLTNGPQAKSFELRNFEFIPDPDYVPPTVTGLSVISNPDKTAYAPNEAFSTAGLVVEAEYSNGNRKLINNYTLSAEGIADLQDGNTAVTAGEGKKTITVTFEGRTTSFEIDVILDRGELDHIEVFTLPSKVLYDKDEPFSSAGLVVRAKYTKVPTMQIITGYTLQLEDGSTNLANITNDFDLTVKIIVSYTFEGVTKEAEFTITTKSPPLTLTDGILFYGDWAEGVSVELTLNGTVTDNLLKIGYGAGDHKVFLTFNSPINLEGYKGMEITFQDLTAIRFVFTMTTTDGTTMSYVNHDDWNEKPSPTFVDFDLYFQDWNGTKKMADTNKILDRFEIYSDSGPVSISKFVFVAE